MSQLRKETYKVFFEISDPLPAGVVERIRRGNPEWQQALPSNVPPGCVRVALVEITGRTLNADGSERARMTPMWKSEWFQADRQALVAASDESPMLIPGSMDGRAVWFFLGSAWTTAVILSPSAVLTLIREQESR